MQWYDNSGVRCGVYLALAFLTTIIGPAESGTFSWVTLLAGLASVCIAFNAFRTNPNNPPALSSPPATPSSGSDIVAKALIVIVSLLWLAATPALAQSVKIPAEIKGAKGAWIIVAPTVDGGAPKWRIDPGLQEVDLGALLPSEFVSKLKGRVFTSNTDGRFKIEIWCAKADVASDIATVWVVVGTGSPDPPPAPPAPPVPVDAFTQAIQAAYAADTATPNKAAAASQLAALYRNSGQVVNDPTVTTRKALLDRMHTATAVLLPDASLASVRRAIADEFNKTIGTADGDLTAADRAGIVAQFTRAQKALETLK